MKEFLTHEDAIALNKLGFNEACLICKRDEDIEWFDDERDKYISIPTYQRAFVWFRENTIFDGYIEPSIKEGYVDFFIVDSDNDWQRIYECEEAYSTREDAELACIKKLIELENDFRKK